MTRSLDIGDVVSDAFRVIKRRWKDLAPWSLLLLVLPAYFNLAVRYLSHSTSAFSIGTLIGAGVVWLLSMVFHGGLFYATGRDLEGKAVSLEDMLRVGFRFCRRCWPSTSWCSCPRSWACSS